MLIVVLITRGFNVFQTDERNGRCENPYSSADDSEMKEQDFTLLCIMSPNMLQFVRIGFVNVNI